MSDDTSVFSIDSFLKLITAIFGGLYILGFFISNLHLMEFGISDFKPLHGRNVMIGALFLTWLALLIAPLAWLLWTLWRLLTARNHGVFGWALMLFSFILGGLTLLYFAGILTGFLNPWGRSWEDGIGMGWTDWNAQWGDMQKSWEQFKGNYGNKKVMVGMAFLSLYSIIFCVLSALHKRQDDELTVYQAIQPRKNWIIITIIFAMGFLLIGFAQHTYPNMIYNMGGGQPAIAQLQITGSNDKPAVLPGINLSRIDATDVYKSEPVVIWAQSDKFLHIRPLSQNETDTTRLVSIDLKSIQSFTYLTKVVRFGPAGDVLEVFDG